MMADKAERRYDTLQSAEASETICEALLPSAPDNTPQNNELKEASTAAGFQKPAIHADTDYLPSGLKASGVVIVTINEINSKVRSP